jgi:hypothetical protein
VSLPYHRDLSMARYLRAVIAPALGLECEQGTVRTKVHTPELRVVFNNECRHRRVGELLADGGGLIANRWPHNDPSTERSLEGNALIIVETAAEG